MINHQSCLIESESFPKVNVISSQIREHGQGRGHGRDRGRNFLYHGVQGNNISNSQKKKASMHH